MSLKTTLGDIVRKTAIAGPYICLVGAAGLILHLSIKHDNEMTERHLGAAKYIAMQEYVPVGNGGALSEMNGHVSQERREMYERIQMKYLIKTKLEAPARVIREYEILTDQNLTQVQREEKIRELSIRYGGANEAI